MRGVYSHGSTARAPGERPVRTNADLQPWELERDAALERIKGVPAGILNLFSMY